ncbi:MAG: GNAT family N-acetyltransferase [Rhodothermales bacterium]
MVTLNRFTTKRLTAERLHALHLDDLLRMDGDPRVMDALGGVRSEVETREYLRRNLDHWDEHGFGLWMLSLRADDSFVGRASLRHLHIADKDEIAMGYALLPEFWGMGLATEIATAIADLALTQLGLDSVVAGVRPDNLASRRVLEKIGTRFERDTSYKEAPHMLYRLRRH